VNRFQFVADHRRRFGVKRLCTILGIARSSFYYWRRTATGRAARRAVDARLASRIRRVHRESDGTYGVPRITAELRFDAAIIETGTDSYHLAQTKARAEQAATL
jgi:transposase-like protein